MELSDFDALIYSINLVRKVLVQKYLDENSENIAVERISGRSFANFYNGLLGLDNLKYLRKGC